MKTVKIIIQARLGSSRLKNKVLLKINNHSLISILLKRLSKSKYSKNILVAISKNKNDDALEKHLKELKVNYYRGSEDNVLKRFYKSITKPYPSAIVRVTADCPLLDYRILDKMIKNFFENYKNVDFLSNTLDLNYPDGQDIEIFKYKCLKKAFLNASSNFEKEHLTQFLLNDNNIIKRNFNDLKNNYSNFRLTVDYKEDLKLIKKIVRNFPHIYFSLNQIIKFLDNNPSLKKINSKFTRNNGYKTTTGQKLFEKAKKIIPRGTMLVSKNPDLFLPGGWPTYFSKSKGCEIWDMDKNKYTDMSYMGVGTNILGYSNKEVDNEVKKVVNKGNMSTFNCPEEVHLASELLKINPWAEKVRFTRSGGEANAVAVRIARTASKFNNIAVCGYHGWHDWYLAANKKKSNKLSEFIIPGLLSSGVPNELSNTVYTFKYNDLNELEKLIKTKKIGIVKMEVQRNEKPKNNFLQKIRSLTEKNNIILIFDECTSGFRETFGGLYKKYNVTPDMLILGKALGNGYAINAIIGNRDIMKNAENTFISSTFWTERIGPTAALKTLEVMKKTKSWENISLLGKKIKKEWKKFSEQNDISLSVYGIDALPSFIFNSPSHQKYKTFITQYFLEKKILATNSIYVSTEHTNAKFEEYFYHFEKVIKIISDCENGQRSIDKLLKFPVSKSQFGRLN